MEKRVTYDNAIPPGCQCQPEERESPGAEDTLWAVRASFEIRRLRVPSVGVRIFTTHFPHKKEGASYLLPKVPGTIMKKCYQK